MQNMGNMLEMASKQLNIPADELKELLKNGDINSIMAKMNSEDSKKLKDALSNPHVAESLKKSPEMKDFMANLNKNGQ